MLQNKTDARLRLFIALGLIVITVAAYWPVFGNGFINYDDDRYVYDNPRVQDGLSISGVVWAFTSTSNSNWHPLTWVSHMVDTQIWNLRPLGHHLTNLLFHAANTLLLFLLLTRLTGLTWRSAFVAALFAVHPLHVESVAWVSERKDVLSTFFLMLTLLAYVRYAQCPGVKRYLLVTALFALGLMAKPMLVTVPIILLLLDYWPLRRFAREAKPVKGRRSVSPAPRLLLEKAPLFAFTLASCVVTMVVQRAGGAMNSMEGLPLTQRVSTVVAGYAAYILKMFWPMKLGVIYPYPSDGLPAWQVVGSAVMLGALTVLFWRARNSRPYLAFGWAWFMVTLVPVIGIVQVGSQFIADRYTYIPLIGLFVAIAWGVPELVRRKEDSPAAVLILPAAVVIVLLSLGTFRQAGYWKDGFTLFTHTLAVAAPSAPAHTNLGTAYANRGDQDSAIEHFKKALEINPAHANAHFNLGNAYFRKRMYDEAVQAYQVAVEHYQNAAAGGSAEAYTNLGNAYQGMRMFDLAEEAYGNALEISPDYLPAVTNLGNLLKETGRFGEAEELFRTALKVRSKDAESHNSLGVALAGLGKLDEAVEEFEIALKLDPRHAGAHVNLANIYASRRELDKAAEEYRIAIRLKPKTLEAHHNLGLVLKMQGDVEGAIAQFRKAVEIDPSIPGPYVSLATALYAAGDYAGAWQAIHGCEEARGRPPQEFVDALSARMPDPGR